MSCLNSKRQMAKPLCLIEIYRETPMADWLHYSIAKDTQNRTTRKALMKSAFFCLLLLTTICYAAPAPTISNWYGKPQNNSVRTLHVNGVPMTARLIMINSHQMGCSGQGNACSAGPQLSFWIQNGTQSLNCSQWYQAVQLLEERNPAPYPYLQLVVTTSNQVWTDERIWVYPPSSVSCNGALDWTNGLK